MADTMTTEAVAGHRHSEGRARFNRVANVLLILVALNALVYTWTYTSALSSGQPVSILESHDPDVISYKGRHARVKPEVYGRLNAHGGITLVLAAVAFVLKFSLIAVNAKLPASKPPDPLDELGPVRIASDGVAHAGGVHWPVVLPRDEIEHLELIYVPGADKPVALAVFGVFFLLLGLPLAVLLAPGLGELYILAPFCLFAGLAATGAWMLWFAMKKRFVLVAHTLNGPSRMVFHRNARREDVIEFATSATRRHDYPFDFGQGLVG